MKQKKSLFQWVKASLNMNLLLVVFTACLSLLFSCRKELVNQPLTTPTEKTANFKSLSVQEAKSWYMQHQFTKLAQPQGGTSNSFSSSSSSGTSVTSTNVIPIWAKAVSSLYCGQKPIIIAPFAEPSFFKYTRNQTAYLIIFRQNDNTMNSRIMVFEADSTVQNQNPLAIQTFSGVTYQVNEHGNMGLVYKCLNGAIVAELRKDSSALGVRDGCDGPGPGDCYGGWGDKNTNDWLDRLGRWFTGIWTGGSNGSGGYTDDPRYTFRDNLGLNGGIDIPDPSGGPSGGGGLPLGNMLSSRNFSDVNVAQMITTCQNSDYEDMVTFGLRLSDPSTIANAPALVTFKGLGHQWADYFLNAASHHYTSFGNVDFSTALLTVAQNRNNSPNYFNGISFALNTPVSRAAYGPLIGAYDRMMVDWSSTNGNCAAFSYTTAESFDNFKGLFADNLFQELGISAAGVDPESKQRALSWLFVDNFINLDCISAYFEMYRQYPGRMSGPTSHFGFTGMYMKYKNMGLDITSAEFIRFYADYTLFPQTEAFLNRKGSDDADAKAIVQFHIKNLGDSEYKELVTVWPTIPPFLWAMMKDLGVEIALKLVLKYVPGFNEIGNLKSAINNVQQGEWLDFMYDVLKIAQTELKALKRRLPWLAAYEILFVDGKEYYTKITKVWEPLNKLGSSLSSTEFGNIWKGISKNSDFLDKFDLFPDGSKFLRYNGGSVKDVFHSIRTEFNVGFQNETSGQGIYFDVGDFRMTWYPISGTNSAPAIEIKKNGVLILKIRQP